MTAGDYTLIPCPTPIPAGEGDTGSCGKDLYIRWEYQAPIYIGDLLPGWAVLVDDRHVGDWSVVCEDGHVLLVPTRYPGHTCDGEVHPCGCDVDNSEEARTFRASDAARLREVLSKLGGPVVGLDGVGAVVAPRKSWAQAGMDTAFREPEPPSGAHTSGDCPGSDCPMYRQGIHLGNVQ